LPVLFAAKSEPDYLCRNYSDNNRAKNYPNRKIKPASFLIRCSTFIYPIIEEKGYTKA
jgi:hypothetical protein